MFRRSRGRHRLGASFIALSLSLATPAAANPAVAVRIANASTQFDLAYAASASTLGGYVTSDNAPLATILRQSNDAFTLASASANAIAGELIYRAAGDRTRECTFRYTLAHTGTKYVLTTDARATWTGQVRCTATATGPDKAKGDFSVSFTMQ